MVFQLAKKATAVKAPKAKAASMAEMMQIFDHAKKVRRVCFRCVRSLVSFSLVGIMIMPRGARRRFANDVSLSRRYLHYTFGSNQWIHVLIICM